MLVIFRDYLLLRGPWGWWWRNRHIRLADYGVGICVDVLHVEDWRRPEFLQFRYLDFRGWSSLILPLLLGNRTLLKSLLDCLRYLRIHLGKCIVYHTQEILSNVLEFCLLRYSLVDIGTEWRNSIVLADLSSLIGISEDVLQLFF